MPPSKKLHAKDAKYQSDEIAELGDERKKNNAQKMRAIGNRSRNPEIVIGG